MRSLVVSSLPGNPLLVWEGVGLRIAAHVHMHVRWRKLHSAREYESSIIMVDCTVYVQTNYCTFESAKWSVYRLSDYSLYDVIA